MYEPNSMRIGFTVAWKGNSVPADDRTDELREWCRTFHRLELTPLYRGSSLGNLSFRLHKHDNSFIITASELGLKDRLTDDSFVLVHDCDLEKGIVTAGGTRNPSSESMLHHEIYRRRKDVHAVFHGHSKRILEAAHALSIPETCREEPFGSVELVVSVMEILSDHRFILMKNHGFLSLGRTMREAGEAAVAVHEQASALDTVT